VELTVDGRVVAEYVTKPEVDPKHGPRPYLHPVRTLAGAVVTDILPEDHPWHLGVSVAVQDVNGTNLWGGRTYVRDQGYTWLDDHGRIEFVDGDAGSSRLRWLDPRGATLLEEARAMHTAQVDDATWALDFAYTLHNPGDAPVVLGSPATNGRPDGAGYGGFYWRAVADEPPAVASPSSTVEAEVNGSAGAWVAMRGISGGAPYTLVFTGRDDGDRWFVRAEQFPGVGVAFAWERPETIAPGASRSRRHRVYVADGHLTGERVSAFPSATG
jgi:hypothetical protein